MLLIFKSILKHTLVSCGAVCTRNKHILLYLLFRNMSTVVQTMPCTLQLPHTAPGSISSHRALSLYIYNQSYVRRRCPGFPRFSSHPRDLHTAAPRAHHAIAPRASVSKHLKWLSLDEVSAVTEGACPLNHCYK